LAGLAEGDALAGGLDDVCFFTFFKVVLEVFVVCFLVLRGVACGSAVAFELVNIDSFASGLASGLIVNVPPPAEGALVAGPLPVPDWPPPVPPLDPPVLPVCAFAMV
jgi:hypothetical protein